MHHFTGSAEILQPKIEQRNDRGAGYNRPEVGVDLGPQMHAAAGAGALLLGGGVLAREPGRARNRLFTILCVALATWNLGVAAQLAGIAPDFPWHLIYIAGSCAAAPLTLHFTLALARAPRRTRLLMLAPAWILAAGLWISVVPRGPRPHPVWNSLAIVVLGAMLAAALTVLVWRIRMLPYGPERSAFRLLVITGAVAVVAGLSDFVPRRGESVALAGPLATLLLLTVVSALVARHRFLDIDRFLVRAIALLLGSAAATLLFVFIVDPSPERVLPLFVATFVILALAGPIGRALVSGTRGLFASDEPVVAALARVSHRLSAVTRTGEVWEVIETVLGSLPGELVLSVHLRDEPGGPFRVVYVGGTRGRRASGLARAHSGIGELGDSPLPPGPLSPGLGQGAAALSVVTAESPPDRPHGPLPPVPRDAASLPVVSTESPLARILEREEGVLTRRILDDKAEDGPSDVAPIAAAALADFDALGAGVVAPLFRDGRLVGWVGLGGRVWESYLTARVATALQAVANQATACLERAEAVELAKRREALAAVGEMAAGLAHEIRNPLSAIHGAAQVVTAGADADGAREMLDVIQEESARLGRVVGEFLDYARPSSPRRERIDLAALVRRALRTGEAAGAMPAAELRAEADAPPALGDPDQLLRVVENLLGNARDAAGREGRVRVEVARHDGGRVRLSVEDDGPGIPAAQLADLFKPFHTTKPGGTGLGLALVHRMVEAHGGEIRVDGRPGHGAVFTIVLPAAGGVP